MTINDIIIKVTLFFIVFYGAIALTSFISKKLQNKKHKNKSEKKDIE
jgi:hypothetical protein